MSKTITIGIVLLAITVGLGLYDLADLNDGFSINKESAIIGGSFIGGILLIVIGYKDSKRNKFLDNIDQIKDNILKDVRKALDKI